MSPSITATMIARGSLLGPVDNENIAVEEAGIHHGVARQAHEEGRRRMLDQKLVEIELAFEIVIRRDGNPAGTRDRKKGNARAIRREARKPAIPIKTALSGNRNITRTNSTAARLGASRRPTSSLRKLGIKAHLSRERFITGNADGEFIAIEAASIDEMSCKDLFNGCREFIKR